MYARYLETNLTERFRGDPRKILEFFINDFLPTKLRASGQIHFPRRVTDAPNDGGLDGYLVDENERKIYLVQCKWHEESRGTLDRAGSLELLQFYQLYLSKGNKDNLNEEVAKFIEDFKTKWGGYKLVFIYLSPQKPYPDVISEYTREGDFEHYDLKKIASEVESIFSEEEKVSNIGVFSLPAGYLIREISHPKIPRRIRVLLGVTRGIDLKLAWSKFQYDLLQRNLRLELGSKINRGIKDTARREDRRAFLAFHNGISLVCEEFRIFDDKSVPMDFSTEEKKLGEYVNSSIKRGVKEFVLLKNFQIVNGGQTYVTLKEVDDTLLEDIEIPLRITETMEPEIVRDIAICNNSQNRIVPWDLVANSLEQIFLQNYAARLDPPIFYQRKRGEKWSQVEFLSGPEPPRIRRLFCKKAFQAFASFQGLPGPSYAKTEKTLEPGHSIYKQISESNPDLILMAGLLLNYESESRNRKEPEFTKYWIQWAIAAFGHIYRFILDKETKIALKNKILGDDGLKCWKNIRKYLINLFSDFLGYFGTVAKRNPQSIFKDNRDAWKIFNSRRAGIGPEDVSRYLPEPLRGARTFEEMREKEETIGLNYTVNFAIFACFIDKYFRNHKFPTRL